MKKYKLIKWYPSLNLIRVGFTVEQKEENGDYYPIKKFDPNVFKASEIENNPEFWEEVVEKDYEILSFKRNDNFMSDQQRRLATLQKDGSYLHVRLLSTTGGALLEDMMKNSFYDIYSVKRLSDGEVFTVGDLVRMQWNNKKGIIESIYYNEHNQLSFKIKGSKAPLTSVFTEKYPIKLKQPLFTTEDGVDIFEGDTIYKVMKGSLCMTSEKYEGQKENEYCVYFGSKEAAENYILMNKPCLSINDVVKIMEEHRSSYMYNSTWVKLLTELVKSKL